MTTVADATGHFESRARAAREHRRAAIEEFSSDDLKPMKIVETYLHALCEMGIDKVEESLQSGFPSQSTIYFVHNQSKKVYAMLVPTNLMLLLEIRDVLNDRTKFTTVPDIVREP